MRTIAFTLIMLLPGAVHALGLGKLDLRSGLNEPLDARIELLSPSPEELESLKIGLASSEDFEKAGIDRTALVSRISFEIKEPDKGSDYVRVFTQDPVREPFLNFLLEINWNQGRLFREYTVLLDPPIYSPALKFQKSQPVSSDTVIAEGDLQSTLSEPSTESSLQPSSQDEHSVVYNPDYKPSSSYAGGDYTTSAGDTLWSIASAMRPNDSVSIQQTMMALFRNNPDAFINRNINGLKQGKILTAPELADIEAMSRANAQGAVLTQGHLWDEYRGVISEQIEERPESTGLSPVDEESGSDSTAASTEEGETTQAEDPELRLLAAGEAADGNGQGSAETGSNVEALSNELAIVQENLVALEGENNDLKEELLEAEGIIEDLQSLITLKENELAAFQNQLAESETGAVAVDEESATEQAIIEEEIGEIEEQEVEEASEEEEVTEELVEEGDVIEEIVPKEVLEEGVVEEEMQAGVDETAEEEIVGEEEVLEEEMELEAEEILEEEVLEDEGLVDEEIDGSIDEAGREEVVAEEDDESDPGAMGIVEQYLGPVKDIIVDNLKLIGMGLGGILAVVLAYVGFTKWRANRAEVVEFDEADIMDLDDLNEESGAEGLMDVGDSATVDGDTTATHLVDNAGASDFPNFEDTQDIPIISVDEEEPEDDPLAEVNVFLAYEHFDQAASFVKSALDEQPDNLSFHTKLLEVYYAANDKAAYEEAAKVLHDKVDGTGHHWDMALAMWSEMSPNRALFEEGEDGLAETQEIPPDSGGIVDLTSAGDEASESTEDAGLDFDVGDVSGEDQILDLTNSDNTSAEVEELIGEITGENALLDLSAEESVADDILDLTAADNVDGLGEDLLDVTAALDLDDGESSAETAGGDGILDLSDEDDILDITSGAEDNLLDITSDNDLLDVSAENAILDVTSVTNLQSDSDDDLLDLTSASAGSADISGLLDLELDEGDTVSTDDNLLEGNGLDLDFTSDSTEAKSNNENVIDFDPQTGVMDIDQSDTVPSVGASGLEDIITEEDDSQFLDLEIAGESDGSATNLDIDLALDDTHLGQEQSSDDAVEDLSVDLGEITATSGLELDLTNDADFDGAETQTMAQDFDLNVEASKAEPSSEEELSLDMDGTVSMPDLDLELEDDEDDANTVFVPRSTDSDEQSLEDEISTKLDLAKAYVELGDSESAKTILDEIIADGNDDQKQQAQELLSQV